MTARELIKYLESCDLDKDVAVIMSIVSENEEEFGVLLREVKDVIENEDIIGIQ